MKILFTKRFSKDLDVIVHDAKLKTHLLQVFEQMKQMDSLAEFKDVRKIQGYKGYYRIRIGDYRLGIKATEDGIEMLSTIS